MVTQVSPSRRSPKVPRVMAQLQKYVYFNSGAGDGRYQLSNLFATQVTITWPLEPWVPIFMQGMACTYPSSEHAYVSLRSKSLLALKAFLVGSAYSYDVFETWPITWKSTTTRNLFVQKNAYWSKKGMCGIVPKMLGGLHSSVLKSVFQLDMIGKEAWDDHTSWEIWGPILVAKYHTSALLTTLLKATGEKNLIEFDRTASSWNETTKKGSYYAGRWAEADDAVIGNNFMGKCLMRIRDSL